ncbi:zinc-binding alcohol dehydrogenase family protein [Radicibacter daui]|uniref:zinc-binding alcohol dehydrogenase family protein n=1 Tax=Radicibacter daui TaxID=3064829 RepID=UPI004046B34A
MKALVCLEPGRLELQERPAPLSAGLAPGPGEVLIDISHIGICGTDYHIWGGKHPFLAYPRVMGHELSATVRQGGEGTSLAVGTGVIVNPYISCGSCIACRAGKANCCTAISVLGVHRDGGMCGQLVVPERNLYPAGALNLRDAAMVEFLAIGAHAVRRSLAPKGARALVVGIGPIGLGAALFARIAGFEVTLLDASAERLEFAADKLGFGQSVELGAGSNEELMRRTGGEGYEVVFDATGNAGAIMNGFRFVAHGGAYVLISVVKDEISFADPEFHKREMMLIGSRNATKVDFGHVTASIAAGLVPLDLLATHRTTLEGAVEDLPRWAETKSGLIKAIIEI